MALVADVGMDLSLRRARLERIAARTLDCGGVVFRMDAGLHKKLQVIGRRPWVVGWRRSLHLSPITNHLQPIVLQDAKYTCKRP
jgi:hypothetical protein